MDASDPRQLMAKAVKELRELRARVKELEAARDAPIAIVGMGCRFPGADDLAAFWELVRDGRDAITEVPASRWDAGEYYDPDPGAPGKMATRRGGFIGDVDEFDAAFFGVSPPEARSMDPQQRLLLEVAWEALEHAGIATEALAERAAGVYVGICSSQHACNVFDASSVERIDAYHGTGSTFAVAAGRISHFLGLKGPSLAVDTVCSSSLVALHLACQGLRAGECELALAGGVNLLLGPQASVSFSKAQMLSVDGRCKTFAASADGYGRGEGCGVVVLRRLSDALARGERVLAVVRGSAVNHDGHASGLTVPNGPAQVEVVRAALKQGGVDPARVGYVEAHGTGTSLGDPIEVNALGEVFGQSHTRERPLLLGSVKANIGHLEAAAGISGLIKVVLALQHRTVPPHPIEGERNPYILWDRLPVDIPPAARPWASDGAPRVAGVSSFGFSGTNVHVVLEEAPEAAPAAPPVERPLHVLALSARSEGALRALGAAHLRLLGAGDAAAGDVCFTANTGRTHFRHRACAIGRSAEELRGDLDRALAEAAAAPASPPKIAFLFTGQGSQQAGMARGLYEAQPTFRRTVDRCAEIVDPLLPRPIREVLFDEGAGDAVGQTAFTQPALFIVELALAELWRQWGVTPTAVLGHSIGEYVAACVAGVMPLDDALRLVVERGRLMQSLPAAGGGDPEREPVMVTVAAGAEQAAAAIGARSDQVSIAAVNAPRSTVLAGARRAVEAVVAELARQGVASKQLRVSHAFHSPLMAPILDDLARAAGAARLRAAAIPLVSNVTGALADDAITRGEYWARHAREAVRFADGVRALRELGCSVFVEVGPRPMLLALGQECLEDGSGLSWIPSLAAGRDDWGVLLGAVAALYRAGVAIDWAGFDRDYPRRRVTLPTYPFERKRHPVPMPARRWPDPARSAAVAAAAEPPPWFYEARWEPAPELSARPQAGAAGAARWLILGDRGGVGEALAAAVRERGGAARVVVAPDASAGQPEPLERALAAMEAAAGPPSHVVHLWSLDALLDGQAAGDAYPRAVALGCASALELGQALARRGGLRPHLAFVTCGAVAAGAGPIHPSQSPLWGFARSMALELPELRHTLVDVDRPSVALGRELHALLSAPHAEGQIAIRDGKALVCRLARVEAPAGAPRLREDGAYLVTGGTGALGLHIARRLADLGARHLVLVSRGGGGAEADGARRELEQRGVACTVVQADVARPEDVARALEIVDRAGLPLRGVFHAAGVAGARDLSALDAGALQEVLAPKWRGAWNLHEACEGRALDHFVCTSSIASLWGSRGQAHYAAANAFLDGLAAHRRARGAPGVSVQWGPWDGGGMTAPEARKALEALGVSVMPPRAALACLERALGSASACVAVADVDWSMFKAAYEARGPRPFLAHMAGGADGAPADGQGGPLARRLAELPEADRRAELLGFLRAEARRILETEELPDIEQGLFEMGFDSLMAVELRTRLAAALGRKLPTTVIFDYPRLGALADHVLADVLDLAPRPAAARGGAPDALRAEAVRNMSEDEAEALLLAKLSSLGDGP
uniref:Polyketide synthase n=1 Tax=Sorangium cellulosum TaxID=56 RepID=V5UVP3_SORCE|nr:polyketide synthase [Sorangium cellulosum]